MLQYTTGSTDSKVGDLESLTTSSCYNTYQCSSDNGVSEGSHAMVEHSKVNLGRWGLLVGISGVLSLICVAFVGPLHTGILKAPLSMEVVYPDETGYNIDPAPHATLDADLINRDDIAFCEGAYVYGVTARIPSRGCVAVAHQDLYSDGVGKYLKSKQVLTWVPF